MARGGLEVDLAQDRLRIQAGVDHGAVAQDVDLVGGVVGRGDEEPRLVAEDRPAEGGLVAVGDVVVALDRHLVRLRAPILALRDVEEVAVELVGAGLGDDAGDAAGDAAVLGAVTGAVHAHLGQRGGGQEHARRTAAPRVGGVDAVDERRVLLPGAAVDAGAVVAQPLRVRGLDHAGHHVGDRLVVARVEAQVVGDFRLERGDGRHLELVDQRRLGGDGDRLTGLEAESERDAGAAAAVDVDRLLGAAESFERGADGVVAGDEQTEPERAILAGDGNLRAAVARQGDVDAGKRPAAGVVDGAFDGARLRAVRRGRHRDRHRGPTTTATSPSLVIRGFMTMTPEQVGGSRASVAGEPR